VQPEAHRLREFETPEKVVLGEKSLAEKVVNLL